MAPKKQNHKPHQIITINEPDCRFIIPVGFTNSKHDKILLNHIENAIEEFQIVWMNKE